MGGFLGISCHNTMTALEEVHMQVVGSDHRGNVFYRSAIASFQAQAPGNEILPGEYAM